MAVKQPATPITVTPAADLYPALRAARLPPTEALAGPGILPRARGAIAAGPDGALGRPWQGYGKR